MIKGIFHFTVTKPDGRIIKWSARNSPTHEGVHELLEGIWKITGNYNWQIGFVADAGFTAYDPTDTEASHPGWSETGNRITAVTFGVGLTANHLADGTVGFAQLTAIDNNVAAMTARGCFIVSTSSPNILWATADFENVVTLDAGDDITVDYRTNLS